MTDAVIVLASGFAFVLVMALALAIFHDGRN